MPPLGRAVDDGGGDDKGDCLVANNSEIFAPKNEVVEEVEEEEAMCIIDGA